MINTSPIAALRSVRFAACDSTVGANGTVRKGRTPGVSFARSITHTGISLELRGGRSIPPAWMDFEISLKVDAALTDLGEKGVRKIVFHDLSKAAFQTVFSSEDFPGMSQSGKVREVRTESILPLFRRLGIRFSGEREKFDGIRITRPIVDALTKWAAENQAPTIDASNGCSPETVEQVFAVMGRFLAAVDGNTVRIAEPKMLEVPVQVPAPVVVDSAAKAEEDRQLAEFAVLLAKPSESNYHALADEADRLAEIDPAMRAKYAEKALQVMSVSAEIILSGVEGNDLESLDGLLYLFEKLGIMLEGTKAIYQALLARGDDELVAAFIQKAMFEFDAASQSHFTVVYSEREFERGQYRRAWENSALYFDKFPIQEQSAPTPEQARMLSLLERCRPKLEKEAAGLFAQAQTQLAEALTDPDFLVEDLSLAVSEDEVWTVAVPGKAELAVTTNSSLMDLKGLMRLPNFSLSDKWYAERVKSNPRSFSSLWASKAIIVWLINASPEGVREVQSETALKGSLVALRNAASELTKRAGVERQRRFVDEADRLANDAVTAVKARMDQSRFLYDKLPHAEYQKNSFDLATIYRDEIIPPLAESLPEVSALAAYFQSNDDGLLRDWLKVQLGRVVEKYAERTLFHYLLKQLEASLSADSQARSAVAETLLSLEGIVLEAFVRKKKISYAELMIFILNVKETGWKFPEQFRRVASLASIHEHTYSKPAREIFEYFYNPIGLRLKNAVRELNIEAARKARDELGKITIQEDVAETYCRYLHEWAIQFYMGSEVSHRGLLDNKADLLMKEAETYLNALSTTDPKRAEALRSSNFALAAQAFSCRARKDYSGVQRYSDRLEKEHLSKGDGSRVDTAAMLGKLWHSCAIDVAGDAEAVRRANKAVGFFNLLPLNIKMGWASYMMSDYLLMNAVDEIGKFFLEIAAELESELVNRRQIDPFFGQWLDQVFGAIRKQQKVYNYLPADVQTKLVNATARIEKAVNSLLGRVTKINGNLANLVEYCNVLVALGYSKRANKILENADKLLPIWNENKIRVNYVLALIAVMEKEAEEADRMAQAVVEHSSGIDFSVKDGPDDDDVPIYPMALALRSRTLRIRAEHAEDEAKRNELFDLSINLLELARLAGFPIQNVYTQRAHIFKARKMFPEAVASWQQVLAIDPNDVSAHYFICTSFRIMGVPAHKMQTAEKFFTRTLERVYQNNTSDPNAAGVLTLAVAYYQKYQSDILLKMIERLMANENTRPGMETMLRALAEPLPALSKLLG